MRELFGTTRLVVRPFTVDDAPAAFAMWRDPEVCRFTGDEPPEDIAVIEADIPRWQAVSARGPGCGFWAVSTREGAFVGDVYVRPFAGHPDEHEIGWHLAREHWGRGLATEVAVGALAYAHNQGLRRLVALVDPEHTASLRVANKAGMTYEGRSDRYDPDDPPVAVFSHTASEH